MLLLTLVVCTSVISGDVKLTSATTSKELLKHAALQLERLAGFRRSQKLPESVLEVQSSNNGPQQIIGTSEESQKDEDILKAQRRIDELKESASELLRDPRYEAIMQDRIKRSFIGGIANKLVGGVVGAASGASRGISSLSSSNTPEYGYGQSVSTIRQLVHKIIDCCKL